MDPEDRSTSDDDDSTEAGDPTDTADVDETDDLSDTTAGVETDDTMTESESAPDRSEHGDSPSADRSTATGDGSVTEPSDVGDPTCESGVADTAGDDDDQHGDESLADDRADPEREAASSETRVRPDLDDSTASRVGGRSPGEDTNKSGVRPPETDPADEPVGILHRFRTDMEGPLMWIREMLSSVAIVLLIGLLLFGLSGVWPPMVAVESGSMEPNMDVGDLVFVTEPGRFAPDAANNDIGVVTHEVGAEVGYQSFNEYGSVVIFQPPGRQASPIIHRAMFHVEEGEDWHDRADPAYHDADDCDELRHCPAPRDGFITLGDNNRQYDQANGLTEPVAEEWVTGVARLRIPYLGYVRLIATGQVEVGDLLSTASIEPGEALPTASVSTPSQPMDRRESELDADRERHPLDVNRVVPVARAQF